MSSLVKKGVLANVTIIQNDDVKPLELNIQAPKKKNRHGKKLVIFRCYLNNEKARSSFTVSHELVKEFQFESGDSVTFAIHPKKVGHLLMAYVPKDSSVKGLAIHRTQGKNKDGSTMTMQGSSSIAYGVLGFRLPVGTEKVANVFELDLSQPALAKDDLIYYTLKPEN